MRFQPNDEPEVRKHRDMVVRLHYRPKHGEIIALPAELRYLIMPLHDSMYDSLRQEVFYRHERFAIYDDVDHAVDVWDYWIHDDEKVPTVGWPGHGY